MEREIELDGIKLILGRNQGKYPYCHSLLIEDEITAIIDPASDPELLQKYQDKIQVIILSHYHEDHFWFSYFFPEAELWSHPLDAPALKDLERLLDEYRMEGEWREGWKKILSEQFHFPSRATSRLLQEGDEINLGKIKIRVLHTPGHTPGHLCFLFEEQRLIYLADLDLTRFGPWYGDRGSDIDQLIESMKRMAEFKGYKFVVSHETPVYQGDISSEAEKYLAVIDQREEKLKEFLKKPRTIEEIINARIIYKKPRQPKIFYDFGEWAMMTKHLERLMKKGEVVKDGEKYLLRK